MGVSSGSIAPILNGWAGSHERIFKQTKYLGRPVNHETAVRGPITRLKSSLLNWLGVPVKLTDHDFWQKWLNHNNPSGQYVTVDSALQLSAVWACVRLLSETGGSLPVGFYRRNADNSRSSDPEHPLYELLHNQPNADMTAVTFWQTFIASMLLRGCGYAQIHRTGRRVVSLEFLHPDRLSWRRMIDGSIEYVYRHSNGTTDTLTDDEIFRCPYFSLDGVCGLTPIRYGATIFGAALASSDASSRIYANGLRPSGALTIDKVLKPEQREQIRESLEKFSGSGNTGKTIVLEAGFDYKQLTINPDDAQLLQSRSFDVEEICRWFGVPSFMVGHASQGQTNWGTGIEQQNIGFIQYALRPIVTRIEQAIRRSLLAPAERAKFFAEFSLDGLLRGDTAARSNLYSMATQNGWMTRNEVRRLENLPPLDGADELTVQSALVPLAQLGQAMAAPAAARAALLDWLGIANETETRTPAT